MEEYEFINATRQLKKVRQHYVNSEETLRTNDHLYKQLRIKGIAIYSTLSLLDVFGNNYSDTLAELKLMDKRQLEFLHDSYKELGLVDDVVLTNSYPVTSLRNFRTNYYESNKKVLRYILTPGLIISDVLSGLEDASEVTKLSAALTRSKLDKDSKFNIHDNLYFITLVEAIGIDKLNSMLDKKPTKDIRSAHNKLVKAKQTIPTLGQLTSSREGSVLLNSLNKLLVFYEQNTTKV